MTELLQWQIGDTRITCIPESCQSYPVEEIIPGASADQLYVHRAWLQPHFIDDKGGLLISVHGLLIESQGKRILEEDAVLAVYFGDAIRFQVSERSTRRNNVRSANQQRDGG